MNAPVIRMEDVVFRYFEKGKRNILDHVTCDIHEGITVIAGAGGCGKSTLAAVICGLYPENGGYLESGKIFLDGKDMQKMQAPERAKYVSVLFQNPSLQFCMDTLRHEMEFCLENMCVPKEDMARRIKIAAENMRVSYLLDQPLQSMSGGEMQKAEMACLFLIDSACIIMDEPFANIDEDAAQEIIQMMLAMKQKGKSFLIIDHRMDYWLKYADEIILLGNGGHVLKRGLTKENYHEAEDIIQNNGLYFPDISVWPDLHQTENGNTAAAITLKDITIAKQEKKFFWNKKVTFHEEDILLKGASAVFPKGKMSAIIGPSGAGKTTLFYAMLGQKAYLGTIAYGNRNLKAFKKNELYGSVGIVFQNPANQFITQKVSDEVKHSLQIWYPKMTEDELQERCTELLEEYGLEKYRKFSPYMLSQGQQRRLAVLSVLCGKQKILLLDEPTYGQDFKSTITIMEQLAQKVKKEELTVIFITHDHMVAESCADCIYRLVEQKLERVR